MFNFLILLLSINGLYEGSCGDFQSVWDFYTDNRISSAACGRGYTGIAYKGGLSGAFINPTAFSINGKRQFYFEYIYKNNLKWLLDMYLKELHPNFSIGLGLPIKEYLKIGLTYSSDYSRKMDYGVIVMAGDTNHPYKDFKISSFSIPIVFIYRNIIKIGIDLSYTNYYVKSDLIEETVVINFYKIRPKFGLIYSPFKNISFGFTYLPETKETITVGENTYEEPNIFPLRIGLGFYYKMSVIPISFLLDYKYSNDSKEENLVDRKDIHFGLEYDISSNFLIRMGIFTQWDYRSKEVQEFSYFDNYDQIFTTIGLAYKINFLTINLSLMDSHLFSDGFFEQTYINTGLSYDF